MDNDITEDEGTEAFMTQAELDYIQWHADNLNAELAAQEVFDPLDFTEEQEAGWAFEDKLSMYRNEY